MAISISVQHDFRRFRDQLTDFQRTQLPFAAARALTAVAREVAKGQAEALDTALDKPTPFTKKAFGVIPARKTNLTATVFAKDIQAAYLQRVELGGTRLPPKKALVLPGSVRVNAFGNLPRAAVKAALASPRTFVGSVNGHAGIWQRPVRGYKANGAKRAQAGLKLLISFRASTQYRPTLGYRARLAPLVARSFPELLGKAMDEAMRTAVRK